MFAFFGGVVRWNDGWTMMELYIFKICHAWKAILIVSSIWKCDVFSVVNGLNNAADASKICEITTC